MRAYMRNALVKLMVIAAVSMAAAFSAQAQNAESVKDAIARIEKATGYTFFYNAVVMMGYSSAKKTELSSSVVSIKGETLRDVSTPDVGNMLQGKVAGVLVYNASGQPGEAAQIRVRGTGSISASAAPLYVVDGIPGGSFNPNDVETIIPDTDFLRKHNGSLFHHENHVQA